ncbi:MAG: helix-turn-helix domain-containing protein [Boseongicola sp.]|nr:helix-turn-helix domain-containing protein [Boseongicola sp.]
MTRPFTIDLGWTAFLSNLDVRPADLLRSAGLPEDLFRRERPLVTPDGFDRLFSALADAAGGDAPGLVLGQAVSPEVFSPPLFAAYCCENLIAATERLARYKPLIGPVRLESHLLAGGLEVTVDAEPETALPDEYVAAELVFLVNLARKATRHPIRPVAIEMVSPPDHPDYAEFFGHAVYAGPFNRVVFAPDDARRPFLSANPAMFSVFEPELRARLDELEMSATTGDRVRSALMEALPSGQPDVGTVARRLGTSARTLQRRLGTEGTSFQDVLQDLRERLARHYLATTPHTSGEISYLLGYEDPNSFTRAFHTWTGTTPETYRAASGG